MFETLMNLVQQHAGGAITNNPAIPNHQTNDAMQTVASSILGGLQQQAQGGGLGNLLGMVMGHGGDAQQSTVTQGVQQNVQQGLMEKLGISPAVAMSVATAVVPMVLSKLMTKSQDPADSSVDGNSIMGAATGQTGTNWMGAAQSAMADGKLDMSDLMRAVSGNSGNTGSASGGGLGGMLGGLFGGN